MKTYESSREPLTGRNTYRFAEHGGEVEVELESTTEMGLFAAATDAFAELVSTEAEGPCVQREIELEGDDRAMLLVDWLNELVYLAEVDRFVPVRLTAIELGGDRLRATVVGHRESPSHLVKAVTLHDLEFGERGGMWHGRVVLDV